MNKLKLAFISFVTAYVLAAGTEAVHNYLAEQRAFDAAQVQLKLIELQGSVKCTPS